MNAVEKRITEWVRRWAERSYEAAFIPLCIAVDRTAKDTYPKSLSVGERYRQLIRDNLEMITFFMFGAKGARMRGLLSFNLPGIIKDSNIAGLDDILYRAVRCGLLHDGEIVGSVRFHEDASLRFGGGCLTLPNLIQHGLVWAVVCSPVNSSNRIGLGATLHYGVRSFCIDDFWGKRNKMMDIVTGDTR